MAETRSRISRALEGIHNVREEVGRALRADSWINAITGLGGSRDRTTGAHIAGLSIYQPTELEALYHGNDLAAKIVDKPVKDALRQGFEIAGENEDTAAALRKWKVSRLLEEAGTWGRLYGAGAILIGLDDSAGLMDEPLDIEKIRPDSLLYLMPLDRQNLSIVTRYRDALEPKYGEPETYRVTSTSATGTEGRGGLVHASRLVMFGGALTSERVRIQKNAGYDLSVLQRPGAILRDVDQSWRSVMNLMQDLSQAVFSIHGLIDMIAEGEKDTMLQRMEIVDMARSVARAVVVDAEHESFEHVGSANVTGISPMMAMVFQRLAAAADMPLTILMGMSPAGMNATGESDTRGWYDTVQSYRESELSPAVQVLVRVIEADAGRPIPAADEPEVIWPPLWQPTPTEQADLDKSEAETDKIRIDSQVLMPEEITLVRFRGDPAYADVIDFALREETLKDPEPIAEPEPSELDRKEPSELDRKEPEPAQIDPDATVVDPKTALNGAQVQHLKGIVVDVAQGIIPRETGIALIVAAFPISEEEASKIMGPVGLTFKPTEKAGPPPKPDADL